MHEGSSLSPFHTLPRGTHGERTSARRHSAQNTRSPGLFSEGRSEAPEVTQPRSRVQIANIIANVADIDEDDDGSVGRALDADEVRASVPALTSRRT